MAEQARLARLVAEEARAAGVQVYVVGGVVRDILRGSAPGERDVDFVVEGGAEELIRRVAARLSGRVLRFEKFLTAKIVFGDEQTGRREIDFAMPRSEVYPHPGSLPEVRPAAGIRDDLRRRDFTVNAMALPLAGLVEWLEARDGLRVSDRVVDVAGGKADLAAGLIRVLHRASFIDDPTRIFRGCRYAVRLGFAFEGETKQLLRTAVARHALDTISRQRVLTELKKIAEEPQSASMLELLHECGALAPLDLCASQEIEATLGEFSRQQHETGLSGQDRYVRLLAVLYRHADDEQRRGYAARYHVGRKLLRRLAEGAA